MNLHRCRPGGWMAVAMGLGQVTFLTAAPIISEFMAANKTTLADEDGAYSDWIEIHNPDATAVDLTGWRLTDSAAALSKWVFPAVTLQPGEFRIVFASGKNKTNPAGVLHTNFALSAGGEYLGLISPTGTVATEFAPLYPAQEDDVSFGSSFSSSTLVATGQTARYSVPTSATPSTATWIAPGFNDAGWANGATGIGFGLLVPGMTVKEVQTNYAMGTLAAVDAALAGTPNPPALVANTQIRQVINFLGDGADGVFPSGNLLFALPGETHGLRATGFVNIPTTGAWTFGVNSDDGSRLRVDINGDGDFGDAGETVIYDDSGHGPQSFFGTVPSLSAGPHKFEFVFFENYGGDEVELFAQSGTHASFNAGFRLIGDTANGGLAVSTLPDGTTGGSGSVIATNVQASMLNQQTSCYLRSTFSIANTSALNALSTLGLGMSYNDGFVAYLNGIKIAERNAPAVPAWNTPATASRDLTASLTPENINVTAFKSALVVGTNKLAVHGMNVSAADSSFLVLPTLTGGSLVAGGPFFFKQPTPGMLNNTPTSLGFVADTTFSHKRGLYSTAFTLSITSATPGASIRYTLDGTKPTETNGTLVAPPNATTPPAATLAISTTRVVRAMAFKTGYDSTNVDTNTYLFLDSVVQQPQTPPTAAWPGGAGPDKYFSNGQEFDYGMDPSIVNNADPSIGGVAQVKAALQAIPSVCVSVPVSSLVDPSTGIYNHAGEDGFAWEREASIEMLNDPNTADQGFQENCGLRIRGGYSRSGGNPKHAFRIIFRGDYGAGKIDYPIFKGDDTAVTEFDKFDLQTAQNYSWSFGGDGSNTFLRELWCRDTQLAMKQPTTRGRFVHLYLNGTYWGLYQIQERAEADYAARYFGGADDDYDVVKVETSAGYVVNPTAGDLTAWNDMWAKSRACYFINTDRSPVSPYGATSYTQSQKNAAYFKLMGRAADGVTPTADPIMVDPDNLIDYMLIIFFSGNTDAPLSAFLGNDSPNNFYAIRDRRGGRGFIHIQHDGEHSLNAGSAASNRVGPFNDPVNGTWNTLPKSNAQFTHQDLAANAEYRMRFADRVHKHLLSANGVLNTVKNRARLSSRASVVESAIIAESARWGDSKTEPAHTANTWRNAANATLSWFGNRNLLLLSQLQSAGLYPAVSAPVMSQPGGQISSTTPLTMSSGSTTIYYTINGADPRQIGGGLAPTAQSYVGGTVTTVTYVGDGPGGSTWRYLDNGTNPGTAWRQPGFAPTAAWKGPQAGQLGYGEGDETAPAVGFGPDGNNKYPATYFLTTFNIANAAALNGLADLTLNVKRDDGIVVYLNGTEIVRDNMPAGEPTYQTYASANAGDDGQNFVPFSGLPLNLLTVGTNTLAVEVHQVNANSSDLSFDCRLTANRTTGGTQILLPAGVATVRARVRDGAGTWSALNEEVFLVNTQPAAAANLVVSEIMYNPAPPSAAEMAAGFFDAGEFEWIEVQNVGAQAVDLRAAYFFNGIDFTFPDVSDSTTLLPAGGRVILCENILAFRQRYGTGFDSLIAGQFSGSLDNAGERISLKQPDGTVIVDFSYNNSAPWPVDADGTGRSLVLINPSARPDPALPQHWRPSVAVGGSPTASDATTYAAWKAANSITNDAADTDSDGLTSFYEYVHGTSPTVPNVVPQLKGLSEGYEVGVPPVVDSYLTLSFRRNLAADDIEYLLEQSTTLVAGSWTPAAVTLVGESIPAGSTSSQVTYRTTTPFNTLGQRHLVRLRAVQR
jgi:hypothetical protein